MQRGLVRAIEGGTLMRAYDLHFGLSGGNANTDLWIQRHYWQNRPGAYTPIHILIHLSKSSEKTPRNINSTSRCMLASVA